MADPFIAEIMMFGGNFNPRGWSLCNGQLLAISSNTALFSILGTAYGGDGRTTFGLPDLRGRVPVHPGSGPGLENVSLGQEGGANSVLLSTANLPSHTHDAGTLVVRANTAGSATEDPSGASFGEAPVNLFNNSPPDTPLSAGSVGGATAATGSNSPFSIMQPFIGINFIIALVGLYPSRS